MKNIPAVPELGGGRSLLYAMSLEKKDVNCFEKMYVGYRKWNGARGERDSSRTGS